MSWFSGYNPSTSLEAFVPSLKTDSVANPAVFDPSTWPANDMEDGLDLPTFDLYVKSVVQRGSTYSGILEVPEQRVSVGRGLSFSVSRRSRVAIRKYPDQVEFQGPSRVPYKILKPFIQELLVLHHPYLRRKNVLVGILGFAWDIKRGVSDMFTVATPALDLEFAQHGTLTQYLKTKPLRDSLLERRMLSYQIFAALNCLHECYIVHGDLKPDNILVCSSESGSGIVAKLSDFGHSLFVFDKDPSLKKLLAGTQPWNSPEWRELRPSGDFYKSDIYSAGLVVWAAFSLDEDPFNLEGHNLFSKLDLSPEDSIDQKKLEIDSFKNSNQVDEIACQTTSATLASLGGASDWTLSSIIRWRNPQQDLMSALRVVFENTLLLDPISRSLEPGTKALEKETFSNRIDETQDTNIPSTWWASMYFNPRRVSPKGLQLGILRGPNYITTPGAPMVARLSVAISKTIYQNNTGKFTVERRRDAAFFLFRSYFENYGIEEDDQNMELAARWLYDFARLGITSGTEDLCFSVEEFSKRMNRDIPADFPLEASRLVGLQSSLRGGSYVLSLSRKYSQAFPDLFQEVFLNFKSEGLRRLLPEKYRLADLATFESVILLENGILPAATYLHIAASCGNIRMASLLVEKYNIDLNVRESFDHFSPLVTALKFSQADFVLWLLHQGVKAGLIDQGFPVLCLISNFDTHELSTIFKALCQAGSSLNDYWYFDGLCVYLDMLSFTVWASDLDTVELMLAENPSLATCKNALQWACFLGRLDVLKSIEYHLSETLKTPPANSDWVSCISMITTLSPYQKFYLPRRPDYRTTFKYVIERLGDRLDPKVLYNWLTMALLVGDYESLSLWLEQDGSAQFLRRSQPLTENKVNYLEKSALEWAAVLDRKAMFDLLQSKELVLQLERSEGNFPTFLHVIAQRDLLNGKHFCNTRLALGDEVDIQAAAHLNEVTAFEVAIRYQIFHIADILLAQGASIDAYSTDRPTPLGELISSHSRDAVIGIKFLLEHPRGKPSFVVDRDNKRTAIHLASGPDYDYDWQYLMDIEDHKTIMDVILDHFNEQEELDARDVAGFTALHHATYRGCDWAVEKLLKAGANPNIYSCNGIRPLDCAQPVWGLSGYLEAASPNFNVSGPTSQTRRAAARIQCSKLLIAAGGGNMADSLMDLGFKRYLLGAFGLINNAKEDHDDYEPWTGEFPLDFVTRWLSKLRNNRSQGRVIE